MKRSQIKRLQTIARDILLPLVVACVPFIPNVYTKMTEPTLHYVYEVRNNRNPVFEWNRRLSLALKQLKPSHQNAPDKLPDPLLKQIGLEISKSLPAMLSGMGFRPCDRSNVEIVNVSGKELKNIRVHFIGCTGYDSYETYPDSFASASNPREGEIVPQNGPVTIRYDKLLPSGERGWWVSAHITYYGEDTSNCEPLVEAELADGSLAIGKKKSIEAFMDEYTWEEREQEERIDLFFRVFLSAAVVYMFFQVRRINKRLTRNS